MKALIIDDDEEILDLLSYGLGRDGYEVMGATNGVQGLRRCRTYQPDIILLDINLPRMSGFEVCRRIRATSATPIIVLSGRLGDADVVRALRLGADDYLSKPFSQRQLRARMEAVLRRSKGDLAPRLSGELQVGDLVLDLQTYNATFKDKPVQLTRVEFRILHILATNLGRFVPYSRLFEYGWGYDAENFGRDAALLKAHVSHIREKLDLRTNGPLTISNMRGIGYSLTVKDRTHAERASA
jgi:DNA-binding response OmpR family regulator